jgi:GEVED domain/Secretion system C-terminal sorting domain
MKKVSLLVLFLCGLASLYAQDKGKSSVIVASEFHVTRPLREIFAENPVDENKYYGEVESGDREHRARANYRFNAADGVQYGNDDASMQRQMGNVPSLPTRLNIAGQSITGFRPVDPSGAVGPNHYVQMINSTTFKVYNKSSGTVLLTGTLGNLWSPATGNEGDPIVMYDKAADRWFLSQFGTTADRKIYIAISTTSDPTGSYYTYTYTSPQFPDYLKFGVWHDGYYMTSNQSTQKVFAFERTAMLAGTPGARSVVVTYSPPKSGFFVPLAADAADGTLPTSGPCPIFSYSDNGWGTGFTDAMNIYNMAVTWGTTPTATITAAPSLALAAFDGSYDVNWDDVSQPLTTQKLDGIGGAMMYRAQWKTWSTYNSVVLSWAVKISATQRSIKWCELRQDKATLAWSRFQEGVYTPDADTRWMSSICMDNNGSIGLSYLKSNGTSIYPGLYYTGRRTCDPLGTLPVTEVLIVAGTGSQTGGVNRVGDYAQTTLDPDGVTFWGTSEYMGGTTGSSAARTRIFSYQIAPCAVAPVASVSIALTAGTNPSCTGTSRTYTATPTNGGTTPAYQWKIGGVNAGTNSATFTTTALTNGQVVTCVMTSNLVGVTGSPATSNALTATITGTVAPAVAIAITTGSNPSCAGASKTFTATPTNGGTTPAYQWRVNGVNAGTNSATFTTSTLVAGDIVTCVLTSNLACASPTTATSSGITISTTASVTPAVSIALTTGTNPAAAGASLTFTATPTNGGTTPSYQWRVNGVNAGTNSATFTTTTLTNGAVVSCVMTSNAACPSPATATSNSITMTITGTVAYCAASTTNITSTEYISNVVMGTISNATGRSSYTNYTALSTNVSVGTATAITITVGTPFSSDQAVVFVDWNGNGVFTDAGETVATSVVSSGPYALSITPPAGTAIGAKRMRIRLHDTTSGPNATSCGVSSYGEVEDYTLNVVAAPITYCSATTTNVNAASFEYISNVSMGTITNPTGASSYTSYLLSTTVVRNVASSITVSIGTGFTSDRVVIFCDWNNNGVFTDAGETVFTSALGVGPFTTSITPPATAVVGTVKMRIRLTDTGNSPNITSCGVSAYGEVEDYNLNVAAAKTGDESPSNQAVAGTGISSVELSVFPNPNSGSFTIKATQSGTYYLMNEMGQLMQVVKLEGGNSYNASISNLAPGVYFLSGQTKAGVTKQKIVVMH